MHGNSFSGAGACISSWSLQQARYLRFRLSSRPPSPSLWHTNTHSLLWLITTQLYFFLQLKNCSIDLLLCDVSVASERMCEYKTHCQQRHLQTSAEVLLAEVIGILFNNKTAFSGNKRLNNRLPVNGLTKSHSLRASNFLLNKVTAVMPGY